MGLEKVFRLPSLGLQIEKKGLVIICGKSCFYELHCKAMNLQIFPGLIHIYVIVNISILSNACRILQHYQIIPSQICVYAPIFKCL